MPADRRALRNEAAQRRLRQKRAEEAKVVSVAPAGGVDAPQRLVGFDFDCTLTTRHFFKVFAWGYGQANMDAHPHCEPFREWCEGRGVEPEIRDVRVARGDLGLTLDEFCSRAGEDKLRDVLQEVFLGGRDRIALVTAWLAHMRELGVVFAIVTAGTAAAVLRAITLAAPEWLLYFPSGMVWDTSQGRHAVHSVAAQKALILRDLCPAAGRILLVDDSLASDAPPPWVLRAARVELFGGPLPYEGAGVDGALLRQVEEDALRG